VVTEGSYQGFGDTKKKKKKKKNKKKKKKKKKRPARSFSCGGHKARHSRRNRGGGSKARLTQMGEKRKGFKIFNRRQKGIGEDELHLLQRWAEKR